jgi:hypothetical protein
MTRDQLGACKLLQRLAPTNPSMRPKYCWIQTCYLLFRPLLPWNLPCDVGFAKGPDFGTSQKRCCFEVKDLRLYVPQAELIEQGLD